MTVTDTSQPAMPNAQQMRDAMEMMYSRMRQQGRELARVKTEQDAERQRQAASWQAPTQSQLNSFFGGQSVAQLEPTAQGATQARVDAFFAPRGAAKAEPGLQQPTVKVEPTDTSGVDMEAMMRFMRETRAQEGRRSSGSAQQQPARGNPGAISPRTAMATVKSFFTRTTTSEEGNVPAAPKLQKD